MFCPSPVWERGDKLDHLPAQKKEAILTNIPFTVSFQQRVEIFYDFLKLEKRDHQSNPFDCVKVRIRRSHILEDGLESLGKLSGSDMKRIIRVEFLSQDLIPESGIDGGGLFKEFFEQ